MFSLLNAPPSIGTSLLLPCQILPFCLRPGEKRRSGDQPLRAYVLQRLSLPRVAGALIGTLIAALYLRLISRLFGAFAIKLEVNMPVPTL